MTRHAMKIAIIIPARLESVRLPRKLILDETGRPLFIHAYQTAKSTVGAEHVYIATDAPAIAKLARLHGAKVAMTSPHWSCGTERVAAVARRLPQYDVIVNLQADEPDLERSVIWETINMLEARTECDLTTAAAWIDDPALARDPDCVKVVTDRYSHALYFSRSAIPYERTQIGPKPPYLRHLGVYTFRRMRLAQFLRLPAAALETVERLEQLRALAAGWQIGVAVVESASNGINTEADYRAFVARFLNSATGRTHKQE